MPLLRQQMMLFGAHVPLPSHTIPSSTLCGWIVKACTGVAVGKEKLSKAPYSTNKIAYRIPYINHIQNLPRLQIPIQRTSFYFNVPAFPIIPEDDSILLLLKA